MNDSIKMVDTENFQAAFINTYELPVKEKHICYYIKPESDPYNITLMEVYEAFYIHPDSEETLIPIITTRFIKEIKRSSNKASDLILLEASQKTTRRLCCE